MAKKKKKPPANNQVAGAATIKGKASLPDKLEAIRKRYRELKKQRDAISQEMATIKDMAARLAPEARRLDKLKAAGWTDAEIAEVMG